MTASVEELASSLVREFLSRKGLKLTLARMDEELPRTSGSISNRAMLARALHIEKLMKKNKDGGNHLQAMIEVITKYLLDKSLSSAVSQHSSSCTTHVPPQSKPSLGGVATTSVTAMTSCYTGLKTGASVREGGDISGRRKQRLRGSASGDNPPIMAEITPGRASTVAMTMAGRETERPQSMLGGETGTKGTTSMRRGMESRQYDLNPRSMAEWESNQKHFGRKSRSNSMQGDMQCEDLEEVDFNLDDHGTHHTDTGTGKGHHQRIVGQPISLEKAKKDGEKERAANEGCISSYIKKPYKEIREAGMPGHEDLRFTLHHPESPEQHCQWQAAWTVLSQLPKGIPKHWRKTLWSCLAEYGTRLVDWSSQFHSLFSEYSTPEDDTLGTQIVKDVHRTGNTGFSSEEEHAVLKRVLLAYARFNKTTGYCQGFNVLAALILKVVEFDETMALMILVYLVDYKLPEHYFSHTLYALSGDMAVFRHLLRVYLPELSLHMDTLQKEASGTIKKSYSSDNPPDIRSVYAYEPPLADVFSMQWFLTVFATTLPRKACRRVWDAIFLEGSEYMQYAAIAIMAVMEKDLLHTSTAADFYARMSVLSSQLRKAHLMSSAEFLQVVYAVKGCTSNSHTPIPAIQELREKYTYNIYPCGVQPGTDVSGGEGEGVRLLVPLPSRGGSFVTESSSDELKKRVEKEKSKKCKKVTKEFGPDSDRRYLERAFGSEEISGPLDQQIKYLHKQYSSIARQPSHVRCDMQLTPPIARAYCPQQQRDTNPVPYYTAYAADVPLDVIKQSRIMSGFDQLLKLHEHRKDQFVLSFTACPDSHHPLLAGRRVVEEGRRREGGRWRREGGEREGGGGGGEEERGREVEGEVVRETTGEWRAGELRLPHL